MNGFFGLISISVCYACHSSLLHLERSLTGLHNYQGNENNVETYSAFGFMPRLCLSAG
jgi:hypothetical protein